MKRLCHTLGLVALLAAAGCAAPGGAAPPPPPPTSAAAGETTIVAIAPPSAPSHNLVQFLGVDQACAAVHTLSDGIHQILAYLFPQLAQAVALHPQPGPIPGIPAPEDVPADAPPAVQAAAQLAADEQQAEQTILAIRKLAQYGCIRGYPQIEEAFLAALDDPFEKVRFATAEALYETAGHPCKICKSSACCTPKLREKLWRMAFEMDEFGCPYEPSPRVRRMARLALKRCGAELPVPLPPGEDPIEGPIPPAPGEPAPIEGPPPEPLAEAGAFELPGPIEQTSAVLTELDVPQPEAAPDEAADPHDGSVDAAAETDTDPAAESDPEAVAATVGFEAAEDPACRTEVRWELITAPKLRFNSPAEARGVIEFFRRRSLGEAVPRPDQQVIDRVASRTFDWMGLDGLRAPLVRRTLLDLPVGEVSPVLEDEIGFHLVRVLERRCAK
jgi:hypothetical protein